MSGSNLAASHIHAVARHHDLLRESELSRRAAQNGVVAVSPLTNAAAVSRQAVGSALIRVGEWVRGSRPAPEAVDQLGGSPRLAC